MLSALRQIQFWVALSILLGCSTQPLSERDSLTLPDDDQVVAPENITGSFLAGVDTARVRCGVITDKTSQDQFQITCYVVVHQNNEELLANGLQKGTSVEWNPIKILNGDIEESSCEQNRNNLSQNCLIKAKTASVNLQFGFKVSNKDTTRNESAEVLLPYSVRVAAGFVPNLASYQSDLENSNQNLSLMNSKIHLGLQTITFEQKDAFFQVEKETSCTSEDSFYFHYKRAIYRYHKGKIQHFAGSLFRITTNPLSHALRYSLDYVSAIRCFQNGLYVWNGDNIVEIGLDGQVKLIQSEAILAKSRFSYNFHAMKNGELYFQKGNDLLHYDPKSSQTTLYWSNFSNIAISPAMARSHYFRAENSDEFFQEMYSNGTYNLKWWYRKAKGNIQAVLHPGLGVPSFGDDVNVSEIIPSRSGAVYYLKGGELSYNPVNRTNTFIPGKIRRLSPDGTLADIVAIAQEPYAMQGQLMIYGVDDQEVFYGYDVLSYKIVEISANSGISIPGGMINSSDPQPIKTTRIQPQNVLSHKDANFFSQGVIIYRIANGFIERYFSAVQSCRSGGYVASSLVLAMSPNQDIYFACQLKIYRLRDQIAQQVATSPKMVTGITFDKDGTLYWSDTTKIYKLEQGLPVNLMPDLPASPANNIGVISGLTLAPNEDIYFSDFFSSRIRKLSAPDSNGIRSILHVSGIIPEDFYPHNYVIGTEEVLASHAPLSMPSSIAMTSDEVLYFIDDNIEPSLSMKGTYVRKIEKKMVNGKLSPVISTFFGGKNDQECGSAKSGGRANLDSIDQKIESSLSVICKGTITGLSVTDNCGDPSGQVKIVISQNFNADFFDADSGAGNVVEIVRPCKTSQ